MKVTFVSYGGTRRTVEAAGGLSLVEVALQHGIEGIDAECGGACSCATCHVLVDPAWYGRLPAPRPHEADMLAELTHRQSNSRLACQIATSIALDGLIVATPETQGQD